MMEYLFLMNVGIGILMILLAIPLTLRKVKPNIWYGFRTPKTLSDEGIWYEANEYAGKALLVASGIIVIAALVLYWVVSGTEFGTALSEPTVLMLWLIALGAPLVACVIASLVHLKSQ